MQLHPQKQFSLVKPDLYLPDCPHTHTHALRCAVLCVCKQVSKLCWTAVTALVTMTARSAAPGHWQWDWGRSRSRCLHGQPAEAEVKDGAGWRGGWVQTLQPGCRLALGPKVTWRPCSVAVMAVQSAPSVTHGFFLLPSVFSLVNQHHFSQISFVIFRFHFLKIVIK